MRSDRFHHACTKPSILQLMLGLSLILLSTALAAQDRIRKVQVKLYPPVEGVSGAELARAISELPDPEKGMDALFAAKLTRAYTGRAEVTLIRDRSMQKYSYAQAEAKPGKSIAVLGVRDMSTLDFQHYTELRAFWRDTIVVIDSLAFNMARLPGAKPGAMMLSDLTNNSHPTPVLFQSTVRPEARNPVFVLSARDAHIDLADSLSARRLRVSCTANADLTGDALFIFLGRGERQDVLEMSTMLHDELGLRRGDLVDHVEAYMRLWYGTPVRGNVQELLRANELMGE